MNFLLIHLDMLILMNTKYVTKVCTLPSLVKYVFVYVERSIKVVIVN